MLSELTRSYLRGDTSVKELYAFESTADNVLEIIKFRENNTDTNREVLVGALKQQYASFSTSKQVTKNIEALINPNTYTVTTGHQLNLFTGPLYFIYKIISAIQASIELNKKHLSFHFVPVYWMATEDHDFEEINHTYVNGKKLTWSSDQTGMVGEFSLDGIETVISELENVLGSSIVKDEIITLIKEAYLNHANLADATRYLVNSLFEKEGLVIVDGNNSELKSQFIPVVKDELFKQSSFTLVTDTISNFPENFKAQVAPREINLFYVKEGIRERIIRDEEGFYVNETEIRFTESEIDFELNQFPERFSPNVILRPVYQEVILPNIMYIGGGAEVAYWLELKSTFDYHKVSYPLVQIRNSFLILNEASSKLKITDTKFWFYKEHEQVRNLLIDDYPFQDQLNDHKTEIDIKIKALISELEVFDPELIRSLKSTKVGLLKELKRLDTKIMRSVKRKSEVKMNRLNAVRNYTHPNGAFQERRVNFIDLYLSHGSNFLKIIKDNTEPFTKEVFVLKGG